MSSRLYKEGKNMIFKNVKSHINVLFSNATVAINKYLKEPEDVSA